MRLAILILAALALPYAWGWFANWLLERIWPPSAPIADKPVEPAAMPPEFQI